MVVLDDYRRVTVCCNGRKRRNKLYKCICDICGMDKGYKPKNYKTRGCNKCSGGRSHTAAVKLQLSEMALNRYHDPNWRPKPKKIPKRRSKDTYIKTVSDVQKTIHHNMRSNMNQKFKKGNVLKTDKTFTLLDYSPEELIKSLESKFQPGMTWDNYGQHGWHIDHIIPDSWFHYTSTKDQKFKDSWSLSNLQPMWESKNCSKNNRYCGFYREACRAKTS